MYGLSITPGSMALDLGQEEEKGRLSDCNL